MPSSVNGGTWLSGDVIGKGAANLKTNLVIPSGTYIPVIGVDLLAAGSIYIDPTTGLMRIMNSAGTHWELVQDSNLSHNQNGFPVNSSSYPNPSTLSTIAFTNATRTFTITPTGASYSVYVNGIEYTFTTAQTVVITATEGFWFIYYDNTGTLRASQAVWDFSITGMVCGLYWDNTNSVASFFSDERHTIAMGWVVHKYLHETVGTRYETGLVISGYTIGVSGDTNVQIGLTAGELHDEDLELRPTNGTSGTPASTSNYWNQPLNKPATIPVYYQVGATGVWRKTTTANWYLYPDSNSRPYYNLDSAGTWSLADVPSGDVVSYWIFGTNDIDNPIIAIMGQQINTTLANAVANDTYVNLSIVSGLPFPEMKLLYQIILSVLNSYGGTTKSRVSQVNDFRNVNNIQSSIVTPSSNFISSVDTGVFTVTSGQLLLNANGVPCGDLNLNSAAGTKTTDLGNLWDKTTKLSSLDMDLNHVASTKTTDLANLWDKTTLIALADTSITAHSLGLGPTDNPSFNSLSLNSGTTTLNSTGQCTLNIESSGVGSELHIFFNTQASQAAYIGLVGTAGQLDSSSSVGDLVLRQDNGSHIIFSHEGGTLGSFDSLGNLWIYGKLTQSGCLPEDMPLKDVLSYIKKVQPLKSRETQTEVDALERIVLNQQKQIESLLKGLGND